MHAGKNLDRGTEGQSGRSKRVQSGEEGVSRRGRLLFAEFTADRSINPFHLSAGEKGRCRETGRETNSRSR